MTTPLRDSTPRRSLVVVNPGPDALEAVASAVDPGGYDVSFAALGEHALEHIKAAAADVVVLFTRIDDPNAFHLLTALRLDPATEEIPVVTFTTDVDGFDAEASEPQITDDVGRVLPAHHPYRMN